MSAIWTIIEASDTIINIINVKCGRSVYTVAFNEPYIYIRRGIILIKEVGLYKGLFTVCSIIQVNYFMVQSEYSDSMVQSGYSDSMVQSGYSYYFFGNHIT